MRVSYTYAVLCRAERGGNGDMVEIRTARLALEVVEDRLGCINGRASANRDDHVRTRLLELPHARFDACDRYMLADFVECRAVCVAVLEDRFDGLNHVCLRSFRGRLVMRRCEEVLDD